MKKGRFLWSAHRITERQKAGKARNIKGKQLKNSRNTDRRRLPSHGRIPGVSTAFNPKAAQPHHAGQCFVSHYQPEQSQCQPTLPKSARHRFYRSPDTFPPGHGAHCANAHPSGRLPVLLVCTFQGTVRDLLLGPSLSSRKSPRVNTLNLKNSQNISSDPAEYGPGV